MSPMISKKLEEISDLINEVESNRNVSKADYTELLEELVGSLQVRLMALGEDVKTD